MLEYENYHAHSYYSNPLTQPDSCCSISDYAKAYRDRGMKCLILSQHGNRSNVWQQYQLANSCDDKLIPLAAAEVYFVPNRDPQLKDKRNFHLILVAKNMEGFYQLNQILSEANMTGFYMKARVDFELLQKLNPNNFICTTACVGGVLKDDEDGERLICQLHQIFRDGFYLQVQHHPQQVQVKHNEKVLKMYRKYKYPLIYGTDSHYINPLDEVLRSQLLASAKITNGYEDQFNLSLPTPEEAMTALLNQGVLSRAQAEQAMQNTLIFRDFEGVHFTTQKKIPNSRPNLTEDRRIKLYKKTVCDNYLNKAGMPDQHDRNEIYKQMQAVTDTGTADYFIAMKDIVDKGLQYGGILTSTGRGSGVSFATNYACGFTSINRLKCPVKLYPERFTSKDRLASGALPDLDLNMANVPAFQKAGKEILGQFGCLPMIAFGTNKTLSAFKLLARARNLDFETSNEVAKQIKNYQMDVKHAKQNNADDPQYDVDDDVKIENYVDQKYIGLIEDSKQYKGIVTNLSPHPCAHLLLDRDIRRQIGVVRCKAKSGSKQPVYAAYIDGTTADAYGYLKADYLRVDVVKLIDAGFRAIGKEVPSVDQLIDLVKNDSQVWNLYAHGYTIGLNQCEKQKTTERVMRYSPKNVVELAAFVAAVRPGFKSMLETFISRTRFSYNIPSLDRILQTKQIPDSFLMYDQQILGILQAGGIPASDAYACIKAIKKKKAAKVASYGEKFKTGFKKHLMEDQHQSESQAESVVDKIWTIINDAASYMFCAAHSFSMACDSLYCAYLKAHYPYEFYVTMLKLYDQKGNKEKIAKIILQMKRYKGIQLKMGSFGEDNTDWLIDKQNQTISQSLSSIKFMSSAVAKQLSDISLDRYDSFTRLLRKIQVDSSIDTRQTNILIHLNYFYQFGNAGKLLKIFNIYNDGNDSCKKITKSLKPATVQSRIKVLEQYEKNLPDEQLPVKEALSYEMQNVGLCFTVSQNVRKALYFITQVDSTYGVKVKLYNINKGTQSDWLRMKKNLFEQIPFNVGQLMKVDKVQKKSRYKTPQIKDIWITEYTIQ